MKDPAFLFYSKDFYEGTRTMLPEERACYIDLLIYQHQHGDIPNDNKRILMYCSGIDQATLKATLEAKFKQTDKGWVNDKLNDVILNRAEFKNKLSINGTIGQFWKKCKAYLSATDYKKLRKTLETVDKNIIFNFLKDEIINEATLKALLKALLKHIEDVNVDVNVDKDINLEGDEIFNFRKSLIDLGFDEKLVKDWLVVRKNKKATNSETAFNTIKNEVEKTDFDINEILKMHVDRSWSGFKVLWYINELEKEKTITNGKQPTINRQTRETIESNSRGWEIN